MDPLAILFERFRRHGDLGALGQVFDQLAPRLLTIALQVCGNAPDAEDVLQQTFLLAMERDVVFDPTRRLEPWFAGLLTNVARNVRRHVERRRAEALPELASDELGPIAQAERADLLAALRTHLDALAEEQRQVLWLQLQHGLSPADIAVALALPPSTVRMRIHRGLRALRKLLPASLAALLANALPARGLAAVRQHVLAAGAAEVAAAASAAVVATALVGGTLAMKKLVAFSFAVAFAIAMWWWSTLPGDAPRALAADDAVRATAVTTMLPQASGHSHTDAAHRVSVAPASSTGSLRVRVVARAGAVEVPLAGAWLAAWSGDSTLMPFGTEASRAATDPRGEVELSGLRTGPWNVQLVACPEDAPQRTLVDASRPNDVVFVVAASRIVQGLVVDADDRPVPGAQVWAYRGTHMGRYSMPERGELFARLVAITDPAGRFTIAQQRIEGWLGACCEGHGESMGGGFVEPNGDVRLVLGRDHTTVRGVVRDANGAPLAGALVHFTPAGRDSRRTADGALLAPRVDRLAHTDANGRFTFVGAAPGRVRVGASAYPHNPAWRELDIVAFEPAEIALTLPGGVTVVGTVKWADGSPARVSMCSRPTLETDGHYCHCETREDGSYELFYQPLKPFVVVVGQWGPVRASREIVPTATGVARCDFVLDTMPPPPPRPAPPPTASVRGRLVTPNGMPVVCAASLRRERRGEAPVTVTVGHDGAFTHGELPAGEFTLLVDSGTSTERTLSEFEIADAEQRDLGALIVPRLATLQADIVRGDGSPWRGPLPHIVLVDANGLQLRRPNGQVVGSVRLHAEPGVYTVHVKSTDLLAAPQQVELVGDTQTTITVRVAIGRSRKLVCNGDGADKPAREDVLHVTVRDANGSIVVQRDVADLMPDLRGFRYWYLDHVFAFGRYECEARTDSGLRYGGRFEVRENVDDPERVDVPIAGR